MDETRWQQLLTSAREIRERAYAPYSGFRVGAAVLTATGEIFTGANVENASFGATLCAERVALATAVVAGQTEFVALAVITDTVEPVFPCGVCLQVLAEFSPECQIMAATTSGNWQLASLPTLLPHAFRLPPPT